MASFIQKEANRRNAQASTGPKTEEGKSVSAQNATTHGLTSTRAVLLTQEDKDKFAAFEEQLRLELRPQTTTEFLAFDEILIATWNKYRCDRVHVTLAATHGVDPLLISDPDIQRQLSNIESYRRRNERAYNRALAQLRELQTERIFRESTDSPAATTISPLVHTRSLRIHALREDTTASSIEARSIRTATQVPEMTAQRYNRKTSRGILNKM